MDKKAQAAMEFLMTYGWAILAAIIAVGVLAYIGLTDPFNWFGGVPANVQAPFSVKASVVNTTDVRMEMLHTHTGNVNVTSIAITNCGTLTYGLNVASNTATIFTIPCSPTLSTGNVLSGSITVRFIKSGSTLEESRSGSITQKVQ